MSVKVNKKAEFLTARPTAHPSTRLWWSLHPTALMAEGKAEG